MSVLFLLLLHGFRTCLSTLWEANKALGLCIQAFDGGGWHRRRFFNVCLPPVLAASNLNLESFTN